jgi:uncharacterized membrane protein YciS (DUF1049 family)
MPDPVALAEGGPVVILLVGIGFVALGFLRGYVVPGWLYQQEREQRIKAETQAERNTEAIERVTAVVQKALDDRSGRDARA